MAIITQPRGTGLDIAEAIARDAGRSARRMGGAVAAAVGRARAAREIALVVSAYFAYFAVRGFTQGSHGAAVSHAHKVVSFEKHAGFFW